MAQERTVSAESFCQTLERNINNTALDDAAFRQFVRNTLPIVIFEPVVHVEMDGGDLGDD